MNETSEILTVILNDRPLRRTLTGVGNYIEQLLTHLPHVEPGVRVDPFICTHLTRRDWRRRSERARGEQAGTTPRQPRDLGGSRSPWWLRRLVQGVYAGLFRRKARRYQLYHEPNHIPIRCDLPTVTTIHDLSVIVHPQWHPADRVRWYEREFAAGARQTRRFIAPSEFTKREMVERLNIPAGIIDVTYQAPRAAFGPREPEQVRRALARLDLPERFFLYVGTLEPRKNVPGLLDAYAALPADLRRQSPLVVVGAWGWKQDALREKLAERSLSSHVRLMGFIADEELACLYAACTAFVWPTLYEGFGNPPLEAMAGGAPAVVSDVASLPEVVGAAGILLDPQDPPAWTEAMRRLAEDDAWRETHTRGSREQAARFSWARCARQTAASYRAAMDSPPARS